MLKFHVLLLIAVGLALFSAICLPGDVGRKPVLQADGNPLLKADGSIVTKPDTADYVQKHWFGVAVGVVSLLFFALAIVRLLWSGWIRFRRWS